MVERRSRPGDRRAWGLHLTGRGDRLVDRMKRRVLAEDRRQADVLDGTEKKALIRLLGRIAKSGDRRR